MRPADPVHAVAPPGQSHESADTPRSFGWHGLAALGLLALVGITVVHPATSRMHTWPWVMIATFVWCLPLVFAARGAAGARFPWPAGLTRLVPAGAILLALVAVVSAWASPFATASWPRTWPTLAGVALFFVLHGWLSVSPPRRSVHEQLLARILGIAGGAVIAASLVLWLQDGVTAAWATRNMFPFGHSIYTGGFIVLALPWFAERVWRTHGAARTGWAGVAAGAVLALAGTSSRGAVLALLVVTAGVAAGVLAWAPWRRRHKLLLASGALVVGLVVVFANPRLRDLVVQRKWSEAATESNRQRSAMLAAGVALGQERPVLGWGPGSVPLAYPRVRAALDGGVENVLQLHNTPVQIWATLGAAGLAAAVMLGAGVVSAAATALHRERKSVTVAATASLAGYGIFLLTDHQLDVPIFTGWIAANAAILTAVITRPTGKGRASWSARLGVLLGAAVVMAAPAWGTFRDLSARRHYEQALQVWEQHGDEAFAGSLDRVIAASPADSFYRHQAAAALLRTSEKTADPAARAALRRRALAQLEASLQAGTHEEFAHFNLGWLQLEFDAAPAAARHFRAAAQLVPDKGGVYFGLGLALEHSGQRSAAIRAFALEWINDPRREFSPAWELPLLAALRPAVVAESKRLYAELTRTHPPAAVVARWAPWWRGETPEAAGLAGLNLASAEFVRALPAIASRAPVNATVPWARLYQAWRDGAVPAAFHDVAGRDTAYATALARRAARHRGDFRAFLIAGTEDEPPLLRTLRRQRTGYGVLALHPDGPVLTDEYVLQENRVHTDFAADLFPPKGWVPGRFLLAMLP